MVSEDRLYIFDGLDQVLQSLGSTAYDSILILSGDYDHQCLLAWLKKEDELPHQLKMIFIITDDESQVSEIKEHFEATQKMEIFSEVLDKIGELYE